MAGVENASMNESMEARTEVINEGNATAIINGSSNELVGQGVEAVGKDNQSKETQEKDRQEAEALQKAKDSIAKIGKLGVNIPEGTKQYEAAISLLKGKDLSKIKEFGRTRITWQMLSCSKVKSVPDEIQNALNSPSRIIPGQGLYQGGKLLCNRGQFKKYCSNAKEEASKNMKGVYESLFGPGTFSNALDIVSLSTGDGSGTKGINGFPNVGRLFWSYRDSVDTSESLTTTKNYIHFGEDRNLPTEVRVFGSGYDGYGGKAVFKFLDKKTGEELSVTYDYKGNGMTPNYKKLPNGVDCKGVKIIMDPSVQDNYFVSVETFSNRDSAGTYDEVNFDLIIDNGTIGGPDRISKSFEGGKYEIIDKEKQNINQRMAEVMREINGGKKMQVTLDILSDTMAYTSGGDRQKRLEQLQADAISKKGIIESQMYPNVAERDKILKDFEKSFDSKAQSINWRHKDGSPEKDKQGEIALQKQLAMNRFLGMFEQMIQNKSFKEGVKNGTIPFNTRFGVTDDDRSATIKTTPIS